LQRAAAFPSTAAPNRTPHPNAFRGVVSCGATHRAFLTASTGSIGAGGSAGMDVGEPFGQSAFGTRSGLSAIKRAPADDTNL
jgi:hypothetical protein